MFICFFLLEIFLIWLELNSPAYAAWKIRIRFEDKDTTLHIACNSVAKFFKEIFFLLQLEIFIDTIFRYSFFMKISSFKGFKELIHITFGHWFYLLFETTHVTEHELKIFVFANVKKHVLNSRCGQQNCKNWDILPPTYLE